MILSLLLSLAALAAEPTLQGRPVLKHPIVLVHGSTFEGAKLEVGILNFGEYWRNVPEFLASSGTKVHVVELPSNATIGERAGVLKNFIESDLRGQKVNLIAHSLGGLDARYAASVLKTKQILSISTTGTPHRGTPLANWGERQRKNRTAWYWFFRLLGYDMDSRRFLGEITTDYMETVFNPRVPNVSGVTYLSVKTSARFSDGTMSYLLWFPALWLEGEKHALGQEGHDGLVPLSSQGWGKELEGSAGIDHLAQINHHEFRTQKPEAEVLGIYARLYDELRRSGL